MINNINKIYRMKEIKGVIFDLDGVICNTSRYHFLAWKELADELKIPFTETDNERLKGVSRSVSLDILLSLGDISAAPEQKAAWMEEKNVCYLKYVEQMTEEELLPGVGEFIGRLRKNGVKIALGSASKNARTILEHLGIRRCFDYIVDGTMVRHPKPDPEVFLQAAEGMGLLPEECLVFEDAQAGLSAAAAGNIRCVYVGGSEKIEGADYRITGFLDQGLEEIVL